MVCRNELCKHDSGVISGLYPTGTTTEDECNSAKYRYLLLLDLQKPLERSQINSMLKGACAYKGEVLNPTIKHCIMFNRELEMRFYLAGRAGTWSSTNDFHGYVRNKVKHCFMWAFYKALMPYGFTENSLAAFHKFIANLSLTSYGNRLDSINSE